MSQLLLPSLMNETSPVISVFEETINNYFMTDKPWCPVYDFEIRDSDGKIEPTGNQTVKLLFDGSPRANDVTNSDW